MKMYLIGWKYFTAVDLFVSRRGSELTGAPKLNGSDPHAQLN